MLILPTKGFARSVDRHNVSLDVLCDWIEASVLLNDDELSLTDVVDALIEEEIYDSQDFAYYLMGDAWEELKRRQRWIGNGCAFVIENRWIKKAYESWTENPTHIFCVLLALAPNYDWWSQEFGRNYTAQGELLSF